MPIQLIGSTGARSMKRVGTAVTNTTDVTTLPDSTGTPCVLSNGVDTLVEGDAFRFQAVVSAPSVAAADTCTLNVHVKDSDTPLVSDTEVGTTGAVAPVLDDFVLITVDVVVRTVSPARGSSGEFYISGSIVGTWGGAVAIHFAGRKATLLDTTVGIQTFITAEWSAASASNQVQLENFSGAKINV